MTEISDFVVLIPALNPDEKLIRLIQGLKGEGFVWIFVVDDGSSTESADIFKAAEEMECFLVRHEKNLGKGAAIKTALKTAYAKCGCPNGCITADADGQHLAKDIRRVAEMMERYPDSLVLGMRDFGSKNIPKRSRFGNRVTSVFFLMDAVHLVPVKYVPIDTIYEDDNRISHFRPVVDSCRVYGRFLKFLASSLSGAVVDYVLFYIMMLLPASSQTQKIFMATGLARIGSGIVNYLLNRYWSFRSRMPAGMEVIRYFVLFFCQMLVSAGLVSIIARSAIPAIAAKIFVDTILFFISFRIQKNWVFRQEVEKGAR